VTAQTETKAPTKQAKSRPKAAFGKAAFYRLARDWHGYLSALAFLALAFFSVTGLLLNHPEWIPAQGDSPESTVEIRLTPAEIQAAQAAKEPAKALAAVIEKKTLTSGAFQSGEVIDGEAQLRLEGVNGATDILVDLEAGKAEVTVQKARLVDTLNDLHKGKNSGAVWKAIIDASAILVLALSVIGYVLFFSLRFRLRTSLVLTAVSLVALVGAVVFLTP